MASTSKVNDQSEDNTAEELSPLNSDSDTDVDRNEKQNNSDKNSDDYLKTKDEPEDSKSEKKGRKLKSRRRRKLKRRESSSLDRTNSVDNVSEKSALSTEGKKLRKRKQQKVNKFFIDPNGAIERKLEQKYVELEELLNRQFVERKTNLTHLHIGQMEVLRQQYNLSCHGLPPTGVEPYTEGPRRRPHSAHHPTPDWEGESDEAYSAIRQIQQMSKVPEQRRKARSKSAKTRREIYSDNESNRQNTIDINLETASLSSARSPRSRKKRSTSSGHGSQRESTSPSLSPSRGYIPTDNQLRDTDNRRIKEWLRKKNIELRKQRAVERAEKKEKRKDSILKENEKIIARETGRSKVEEWMNQKRREANEQKKAERLRHRKLEEEQKERESKKKMDFVQGKSWMRPASAPASRSKGKGLIASSTDDPSTSTDSQNSRPVPHPPSSKLMYKRSSAGRVRLRAKSSEKVKSSDTDTKPPTEKSLEASQLSYSEWLEKKRIQDAEKKKAEAEAKSKAAAKSDSDLETILPDLHKKRVNKVLKSKKRVDSGLRSEDETQTSQDAESPAEALLTVSGAKAELTTRYSYPRPQSAKLPSPQPCKSPTRPKSAHPRVEAIMDEEEKDESQENPFHLPFPAHLGLPKEVVKTQKKVFPERVAAERESIEAKKAVDNESNDLAVQEINNEEEQIEENIPEEPKGNVEQIEEESPRVGASFFKTDPEDDEVKTEDAGLVDVLPPPAIQEQDGTPSFLETSQEKLEPDKNDQKHIDSENQSGNNNNNNSYTESTPGVAPGGEVNVTELPSEKIPTLEVNDNDIPQEVIEYQEDIFLADSDDEEEEEDENENLDSEQQVVEEQQSVNDSSIPTGEEDQQTITEPESSAETYPEQTSIEHESQYEVIENESELKDEPSEPVQDSVQMTEQNIAPELHEEHNEDSNTPQEAEGRIDPNTQQEVDDTEPVTQQETDLKNLQVADKEQDDEREDSVTQQETEATEEISEEVDEEIEEEIDDETVSQDDQYFLDKRQGKHEPDKLEFLEQVMDSLPEVDDDSKGETSSLEEPVKPEADNTQEESLDQSASNEQDTSSVDQFSQRSIETEQKAIPNAEQPESTNETSEPVQTQASDDENSPTQSESVPNEMTSSDTQQHQPDEQPVVQEQGDDSSLEEELTQQESEEPISEAQQSGSISPPKPITPTLGRHLSNDELLANIQAGKKLISIPYSSDENEDTQTQLKEGAPAEIIQFRDQGIHTGSDGLHHDSDLDAKIINGQRELKMTAVDQIGEEQQSSSYSVKDDKDVLETEKADSVGFNIPIEHRSDADVIEEQRDLKQTTLGAIANDDSEDNTASYNSIEREVNTEQNISPVDVESSEKDTEVINNQETLKAETIEELNNGSRDSPLTQLIVNSDSAPDAANDNSDDDAGARENPIVDIEANSVTEDPSMDLLAEGNVTNSQEKATDASAEDAQNNIQSEEEISRNLQERLHRLRSYDDLQFPIMHQSMHEPSSVRSMGQEAETPDSYTETDTSYQSTIGTPEPQQGSNTQHLSDSFKRGFQQTVSIDNNEPLMSNDVQNDQLVDSQSNLTPEEEQTKIPEDISSAEVSDNQVSPDQESLDLHQNGFVDQNSTSTTNGDLDTSGVPEPSTMSLDHELSDAETESNVSSDEVNNNKTKQDEQTVLDNHDKIIDSLSNMKASIDQTEHTTGDVSIGENEREKLKNLENEFNIIPDNRVEQDVTGSNDNIKPILSSRDDNSTSDSPSSRQKKVSFSNRPIVIQEDANQSGVDTDSDAVDDVLRTMT